VIEKNKHIYDVDLFDIDLLDIQEMISKIDDIPISFKDRIVEILEFRKKEKSLDSIVEMDDPLFEFALSLYLYSNQAVTKLILNYHFRLSNNKEHFVKLIEFKVLEILKNFANENLIEKVSDWVYDKSNSNFKSTPSDFHSFPSLFKSHSTFKKLMQLLKDYEIIDSHNNWVGLTNKKSETSILAEFLVDIKCTFLHTHNRELVRDHFNTYFNTNVSKSSFAPNPSKFDGKIEDTYRTIFFIELNT
jgi:hypothetical protein